MDMGSTETVNWVAWYSKSVSMLLNAGDAVATAAAAVYAFS